MGKPALRIALLASLISLADVPRAGAQSTSGTATPLAAALKGAPAVVTLITGDRVALTSTIDGRPVVAFDPAAGQQPGTGYQTLTFNSHVYVVPYEAAAYLGAPLDLSLFDVTALAAAGTAAPLILDITASSNSAAVPGITTTAPGKGKLDKAVQFGQALRADRSARNQGKTTNLFAGIDRIAVAGTAKSRAPVGKLYTLTVNGWDRKGKKVFGNFATIYNVDDGNTFLASQAFFNGTLAYSVPAGNYQVTALISTDEGNGDVSFSFVTSPQVFVNGKTNVELQSRKTNLVSAAVPDPTSAVIASMTIQREPATGPDFTNSFLSFGPTLMYVSPTAPVTVGQQYFYPYFRLGDPAGGLDRYVYDLQFEYIGGIPDEVSPTLSRADLVTVDATYHSSSPARGQLDARISLAPWMSGAGFSATRLTAPSTRTEYVLPKADARTTQILIENPDDFAGFVTDNWRALAPGQHIATDWTSQPEPPGVEQQGPGVAQSCPACRAGDTLGVSFFPFVDRAGNRTTPDQGVSRHLWLYADGKLLADVEEASAQFLLLPTPTDYQLTLDVGRDAAWWPSSTRSHTVWSFHSEERAPDPLPDGWTCGGKGGGGGGKGATAAPAPGGGDGCSFEPLLFASYDTHAGPDDVVSAGRDATVDVAIHRQDHAPRAAIADLTFDISFDDGASWGPARVASLGDGRFQASYSQPALDATTGFASFRVTATDAEGSKLEQTITRAYPLAVPPPAGGGGGGGKGGGKSIRPCTTAVIAPYMQCMAIVNPSSGFGRPPPPPPQPPEGHGPADIASAYKLPAGAGEGRTVAIVDAYDNPNAEADLATYRAFYGLPPCTTANGCFRKVNQRGLEGPLPAPDPGWGLEISLDLDAVSATCPDCKILLVEADSPNINDLGPAVDTAVALGADAVSNSYGSRGEFSGQQYFERFYKHPGVAITVSSGDYGYGNGLILTGGVSYPGSSQYVTSVGGTTLVRDGSARGWTETAWAGSTSGCSAYIHKPGWQKDRLCDLRTVADVAAVADPQTGLSVYDTFGFEGWLVVGGTSLSSPIIASIYVMAGNTSSVRYGVGPYRASSDALFDVIGGSNGVCSGTYMCNGLQGYDGPTGLGTPNGLGAFSGR